MRKPTGTKKTVRKMTTKRTVKRKPKAFKPKRKRKRKTDPKRKATPPQPTSDVEIVVDVEVAPRVMRYLEVLPPQERRFVVCYCGQARGNGTLAAEMAGIEVASYSGRANRAVQILHMPRVRDAIRAWLEEYAMTGVEVTAMLRDVAYSSMVTFLKVDKSGKMSTDLVGETVDDKRRTMEAHAHLIEQVEFDAVTGKVTKIKMYSRLVALRELAKINKLYSDSPIFNFVSMVSRMDDDEFKRYVSERADPQRLLPAGDST